MAGFLAIVELVVGIFAFYSCISSCYTFIMSSIFSATIIAVAAMSTFASTAAVGAIKSLENYSVSAAYSTSFLSISWLAVAFALAAGLLWLFSICCCRR